MIEPHAEAPGEDVAVYPPATLDRIAGIDGLEVRENPGWKRLEQALATKLLDPDAITVDVPTQEAGVGEGRQAKFIVVDSADGETQMLIRAQSHPNAQHKAAKRIIDITWFDEGDRSLGEIEVNDSPFPFCTHKYQIPDELYAATRDNWDNKGAGYGVVVPPVSSNMSDDDFDALAEKIENGHVNVDKTKAVRRFVVPKTPLHRRSPLAPLVGFYHRLTGGRKEPPGTKAITSK